MKAGIDYIGVSVGILILNDKGDLFLSKRSQNTTNEHGTWEIPGGKVHFGETLQDAAKREAKEEYWIEVEIIKQFSTQNHFIPNEKQHWVPTAFLCKILGTKKPQILEPEKCDEIGWFSLGNLPKPLSIITKLDIAEYQKSIDNHP